MSNLKFSNFNAERREKLSTDFKRIAIVKFGLAGVLSLVNPFLGLWLATAGVMAGCFAGGVNLSDRVLRSKAKANGTSFCAVNKRIHVAKTVRAHTHNHARTYRRGASSTASSAGGDSDGGSDPDQGEPPDPDNPFFLSHPRIFSNSKNQKQNSSESLRHVLRGLGCCCVRSHSHFEGVPS